MFTELLPVLEGTMVTLTISRIDDQLLGVNIIPKRKTDRESNAENALCTPLTVTATAAELDQDLAGQVVSFSHSYQRSAANIREIEEAHAAAVKAAEEERKSARKPAEEERKSARKPAASPTKASPRSATIGHHMYELKRLYAPVDYFRVAEPHRSVYNCLNIGSSLFDVDHKY
jgi:PRTRC genetic system protein E